MEKNKKRGEKNSRSKKGHWRKDCPKAQKRDENKPVAANMACKDENSNYSLNIIPTTYVASSSEWILNIRATYHLCPIREWFMDFSELKSGAVVMGNDQPYHTMGIGTIWFKLFNRMVNELKEVRYVLILKKNIICVGAPEVGTIKFTYGAMVILQEVGHYNLYYLKGGTTNEANIAKVHSDTTKLWHVRLELTREKSL